MTKRIVLVLFFIFSSLNLVSQTDHKDSLIVKLKAFPDNKQETKEYVNTLNKLAFLYRFRNLDSLNILSNRALKLSKKLSYDEGIIKASIRQGDYFSDMGNSKKAQDFYVKAKELLQINNNPRLMIELFKSMSLNFFFNEELKKGFNTNYEAIKIAKEHSLKKEEAILRHNLGYIYWSNHLYDEAEEEYMIADSLWVISGNEIDLARTKSNIALNALDKGNLKMADLYLNKSISILSTTKNFLWLSRTYRVKSRYFIAKEMYDIALDWNQKSDSLLNLVDNPRDKLQVLENYSAIHFKKQELDKTEEYVHKMYSLAKKLNDSKIIRQSHFYLKELEFNKGNLIKMIAYQRVFDSLKLQLDETNKINNLKFLRVKSEYDKEQLKINIENDKKLNQQKVVNRIIIFALIISLIIGVLIRQNNVNQKKANKKLKEINTTKDKIFSIIGHDLKTPLSTLNELLELLKEKVISPKEMIDLTPKIQNNVDYSIFTLNNLLYWAQSQMNAITANSSNVNVKSVINNTVSVFELEASKKSIHITNNISEEYIVKFDFEHLRIIFRNLINNAIKFTPKNGQIAITSNILDKKLFIKICDTGAGVNDDTISKIFNYDILYSTKGTNNEKGTGIGLSICKELLAKNHSQLKVEYNKPNGSCFITVIPILQKGV